MQLIVHSWHGAVEERLAKPRPLLISRSSSAAHPPPVPPGAVSAGKKKCVALYLALARSRARALSLQQGAVHIYGSEVFPELELLVYEAVSC